MVLISNFRINILRAVYGIIFLGLAQSIWPLIEINSTQPVTPNTVVLCMLTSFSLFALIGVRYPLKMLPLLLIEVVWKSIWLSVYYSAAWQHGHIDRYVEEVFFACALGLVLTVFAVPWGYVYRTYFCFRQLS